MRALLLLSVAGLATASNSTCSDTSSLYTEEMVALRAGKNVSFASFTGKVSLAINVASFWGGTPEAFALLSALHTKYSAQGLEILAFQCSQFLNQAPGDDAEFLNSLKYVRPGGGYTPPFEIFSTISVNGAATHPVWQHLKAACPMTPGGYVNPPGYPAPSWTPISCGDVSWNFEKVLVDRNGRARARFSPDALEASLAPTIEALLAEKH